MALSQVSTIKSSDQFGLGKEDHFWTCFRTQSHFQSIGDVLKNDFDSLYLLNEVVDFSDGNDPVKLDVGCFFEGWNTKLLWIVEIDPISRLRDF